MTTTEYGIVVFETSSSAIQAEFVLTRAGLTVKLVPTPREFSSDCGVALRFGLSMWNDVRTLLEEAGVEFSRIVPQPSKARAASAT